MNVFALVILAALGPCLDAQAIQVRLVNGSVPYEGRVEIVIDGEWSTICSIRWSFRHADVICRVLGYSGQNSISFMDAHFGQGTGNIMLAEERCLGTEDDIAACVSWRWGHIPKCPHSMDVGVRCEAPPVGPPIEPDENPCNVDNGGCDMFCINLADGGHVCACHPGQHITFPGVPCQDLQCVCWVSGDPHYRMNDGTKMTLVHPCTYLLSIHSDLNICSLVVSAVNVPSQHHIPAITKEVHVDYNSNTYVISIEVTRNGNHTSLPYADSDVVIFHVDGFTQLHTECGTVAFNDKGRVYIGIPGEYSEELFGLCGNCNQNQTDDLSFRGVDYGQAEEFAENFRISCP